MKQWTHKIVAVWEDWHSGDYRAFKTNYYGPWYLSYRGNVIAQAEDLQAVMEFATLE